MIEIFGPTYQYRGEVLSQPEVIYVRDHHYSDAIQGYAVQALVDNSEHEHVMIFDHINIQDDLAQYPHVCLPVFLAAEAQEFVQQQIQPTWSAKTKTFNFMINKPRPHRQYLVDEISRLALSNYSYSLCWDNCAIPRTNYAFGTETVLEQGILNGTIRNSRTYQGLLQHTVFEPSCVSLITEPAYAERESIITEKTLMAIYGGTIPIWVGGWRMADAMQHWGFDVFDDVVDHSYQSLADPRARCHEAIHRNLNLLTDFDQVREFVACNQHRLQHNMDLVQSNVFLADVVHKINSAEHSLQPVLKTIVEQFRHGMFNHDKLFYATDTSS